MSQLPNNLGMRHAKLPASFIFAAGWLLGWLPTLAAESSLLDTAAAPPSPSTPIVIPVPDHAPVEFTEHVAPLLARYCVTCHSGADPQGDMRLDFATTSDLKDRLHGGRHSFELMARYLRDKEMPPRDSLQPTDAERKLILEWLEQDLLRVDCGGQRDPGRVTMRRLNRTEYARTIRDLLYLDEFQLTDDFPQDDSGYGFDNNGDVLSMSPLLLEQYLHAAEEAMSQASRSRRASARLGEPVGELKETFYNRQEFPRKMVEAFLPRAFRRPVTSEEVDRYMVFVRLSLGQDGENSDRAAFLAMRAALMSPHFLFRMEGQPGESAGVYPLTDFELATRLSYFLWSSMPDEELFDLARRGELRPNLEAQVRRMLRDPKASALAESFAAQWLGLRSLAITQPDTSKFPDFTPELRNSMAGETTRFFTGIVTEDRSILELIDSDYTYVDGRLAKLYGIPGVEGEEFRKVPVNREVRGGLLTQASILTVTSRPNRTAPVLRGKWILENILNAPTPPPPPNVPALEEPIQGIAAASLRQQLEQHRADSKCAVCHNSLDPLGLAFENFDAIGTWRDLDGGHPIDSSGVLPDGRTFQGPGELKQLLMFRADDFRRCFAEKLLTYALGRGLEYFDRCTIDEICSKTASDGDRFSSVILAIVNSDPFQFRRSTGDRQP